MVVKRNKKAEATEPTEVVAVEASTDNAEASDSNEEQLYTVKLDSKRFEGRTEKQVLSLFLGSTGVVSKVTIERD